MGKGLAPDSDEIAVATSVALGLWVPLRAASASAAEPPPPPRAGARPASLFEWPPATTVSTGATGPASWATIVTRSASLAVTPANAALGQRDASTATTRLPLSFATDEASQLAAQRHVCVLCGDPIGTSLLSKTYAPCRLLDVLCCKRRCHNDARRQIPWRVVLVGDSTLHRVSNAAAAFLDDRASEPIIRLPRPHAIFTRAPNLFVVRQLRDRLADLARDAQEGRPGCGDATDAILQRLPEHAMHLALRDCDFWSLEDIRHAKDGTLGTLLSTTADDAAAAFTRAAGLGTPRVDF